MNANPRDLPVAGSIFKVRLSIFPNFEKYSLKSSLGLEFLEHQMWYIQLQKVGEQKIERVNEQTGLQKLKY